MSNQFWVVGTDREEEVLPTLISDVGSAEAAIGAYIEMLGGDGEQWDEGIVKVWAGDMSSKRTLYDVKAAFSPYEGEDAEDGEVECELTIHELEE